MADDQKPSTVKNATLTVAVAQLLSMASIAIISRMGGDPKSYAEAIWQVSMAVAPVVISIGIIWKTHINAQQAQKTEILAPGLTKIEIPEGKELVTTVAINDPSNDLPAEVITETKTKPGDLPEVKSMKIIKQFVLLFTSALCMALMVLGLGGCSNLTPNQRLAAGEVGYIAADVALTAADHAGKIPAAAKPDIASAMGDFSVRLTDAQAWVAENPNLANTPGISPPSLDALDIVRATVRKYVLKYGLFAPLPAIPSTQPVPIPLPG